ncbi:MAG: hypothetical protein KFB93_01240 [Simkaniaceae bacterium]|nr:MAG: hypothetical protein KFB93_01240 [Simkaniaceae bacterium]
MLRKGVFFILALGGSLFGGITERVEQLEKQMKEVGTENTLGSFGLSLASAQPDGYGLDWYTTGELLYWDAKLGGTDYVFSTGEGQNLPNAPIRGSVRSNSFGWEVGGRVGIGTVISHDRWDVYLNFTYYQNHDGDSCYKYPPAFLVSQVGFFGGAFEKAKSIFDLTYMNFDFEMGRKYFMSRLLTLRPHIGLKGTRMRQEQKVKFDFSSLELDGEVIGEYYRVYNRCDFDGLGPRMGIQGTLFIGHGFQLEGELSGAILYCYFEGVEKEKTSPNVSSANANIRLKGKMNRFVPFTQMFLGMSWSDYFHKENYYISFRLGYEILYFWRENQSMSPYNWEFTQASSSTRLNFERMAEDISFYGISFKLRLDY